MTRKLRSDAALLCSAIGANGRRPLRTIELAVFGRRHGKARELAFSASEHSFRWNYWGELWAEAECRLRCGEIE